MSEGLFREGQGPPQRVRYGLLALPLLAAVLAWEFVSISQRVEFNLTNELTAAGDGSLVRATCTSPPLTAFVADVTEIISWSITRGGLPVPSATATLANAVNLDRDPPAFAHLNPSGFSGYVLITHNAPLGKLDGSQCLSGTQATHEVYQTATDNPDLDTAFTTGGASPTAFNAGHKGDGRTSASPHGIAISTGILGGTIVDGGANDQDFVVNGQYVDGGSGLGGGVYAVQVLLRAINNEIQLETEPRETDNYVHLYTLFL